MTAKEMFEELDFKVSKNEFGNIIILDEEELLIIEFRDDVRNKCIAIETEKADRVILTPQIVKVIQKQIEELEWYYE